jgi:hypothetical protein
MCDRSSWRREPPPHWTMPCGNCRASVAPQLALSLAQCVACPSGCPGMAIVQRRTARGSPPRAAQVPRAKPRHRRLPERHDPSTRSPGLPCARRSVRDSPRDLTPPGAATPFDENSPVGHSADPVFTNNEMTCTPIHCYIMIDNGNSAPYRRLASTVTNLLRTTTPYMLTASML